MHDTSTRPSSTPLADAAAWVVAAALFALPFPRVGLLPVGNSFLQVSDLLFVLAGGTWLVAVARREVNLSLGWVHLPLAGYVAWAGASYFVADNPKLWLLHWLAAVYLAGLCCMAGSLLAEERRLRRAINAWAWAASITVLLGVLGIALFYAGVTTRPDNPFLSHYGSIPTGNYPRLRVLLRNPNMLCNYVTLSVALLLAFSDRLERPLQRLRPWVLGAAGVVAFFALSSGLGGLGLVVGLWLFWTRSGKAGVRDLVALGGVGLAAAFVVLSVISLEPAGQGSLSVGPVDVSLSGSPRISLWSAALETAASAPLVGRGLGYLPAWVTDPRAFTPRDRWNDSLMQTSIEPTPMDAHNAYLSVAAQLGLIGFVLLVSFWVWVVVRRLPRVPTPSRFGLAAGIWGAVAYHGLFASLEEARQIWVWCGLVLALSVVRVPRASAGASAPRAGGASGPGAGGPTGREPSPLAVARSASAIFVER